jgi:hypothetical protein
MEGYAVRWLSLLSSGSPFRKRKETVGEPLRRR